MLAEDSHPPRTLGSRNECSQQPAREADYEGHTPGPWAVFGTTVYGPKPDRACIACAGRGWDRNGKPLPSPDAHLIAAAPALLLAQSALEAERDSLVSTTRELRSEVARLRDALDGMLNGTVLNRRTGKRVPGISAEAQEAARAVLAVTS